MTSFITLTEMWRDHQYIHVGETIKQEQWNHQRLAQFCAYFCKYLGTDQLNILHKFM